MDDAGGREIGLEYEEVSASMAGIEVRAAGNEVRIIEVERGGTLLTLVDVVARERGCRVEELAIFRDGVEEALATTVIVDAAYPRRHRHHVHRAEPVEAAVHYNGGTKAHAFRRDAKVEAVLGFAVAAFGIDPTMATEFELARVGVREELPGAEHLGHLAGHHHRLELNLVRGDIANGRSA